MCVDSGETAKILFGSVCSLGGFGSAMEDVREQPALAEQYFLAEDENSCGASGAHSTRYTIVNQTWKVFPVNGYWTTQTLRSATVLVSTVLLFTKECRAVNSTTQLSTEYAYSKMAEKYSKEMKKRLCNRML